MAIAGIMIAVHVAFQGSLVFNTAADEVTSEVLLSNLPPRNSSAYKTLKGVADDARNNVLEMSNSEVWFVSDTRVAAVLQWAKAHGVLAAVLDKNWNRMLDPATFAQLGSVVESSVMKNSIASTASVGSSLMSLPGNAALEYALTKRNNAAQAQSSATFLFTTLNNGVEVSARRTSLVKTADGYIWHGVTIDTDEPVTLLWWASGRLAGTITHLGRKYFVKKVDSNIHAVIEMEPRLLPPEHQSMKAEDIQKAGLPNDPFTRQGDASLAQSHDASETYGQKQLDTSNEISRSRPALPQSSAGPPMAKLGTDAVTIRLIVAYTKQAASHYNDIEQDLIALAVAETNQSFRSSGIDGVKVELAYAYQTNYVERGTHFDHVFRFVYKNDGYMDEVHQLRSKYHANIGILIVHDPNGCGLSAQVAAPADKAFAAIHHECATLSYTFAHEIGHLIGARHDLGVDDSLQPFPFGHGFVSPTNTWRDIMSYEESCGGCPRLPVWSNPDIKFNGMSVGDELRNNARVIRERAPVVAKF
jgi:Metallo-peptidase family M12